MPDVRLPHPVSRRGSVLLEVIIATAIMGLVVTGVAVALTMSLHASTEAQYRELSNRYSSDLVEVLRKERKFLGWIAFTTQLSDGTYCVNDVSTTLAEITTYAVTCDHMSAPDPTTLGSGSFTRELVIVQDPSNETLTATITVQWRDGIRTPDVTQTQVFYRWSIN